MISYNSPKKKSSDAVLQGVTIRAERRKTFFFVFPSFCFFFFLFGVCWVVVVYTLGRDEESTRLQRLLYVCREIKTGKEKKRGKTKNSQNVYVYNNNK
jgi:hypothetical protein